MIHTHCSPVLLPPSQEVGSAWASLSLVGCRYTSKGVFQRNHSSSRASKIYGHKAFQITHIHTTVINSGCATQLTVAHSLAVEHVNTSDQPRRQRYWYHPRVVRLGDRSFPVAAARAWDALLQHVWNAPLSIFRRELKTVLFRSSFPDVIWQCTVLYLCARRSVLICHHVLAATNWFVDIVRWSCSK